MGSNPIVPALDIVGAVSIVCCMAKEKCYCGSEDAYIGAMFVSCPNPECAFFSESQKMKVDAEKQYDSVEEQMTALADAYSTYYNDPDKTPVMPWGSLPYSYDPDDD